MLLCTGTDTEPNYKTTTHGSQSLFICPKTPPFPVGLWGRVGVVCGAVEPGRVRPLPGETLERPQSPPAQTPGFGEKSGPRKFQGAWSTPGQCFTCSCVGTRGPAHPAPGSPWVGWQAGLWGAPFVISGPNNISGVTTDRPRATHPLPMLGQLGPRAGTARLLASARWPWGGGSRTADGPRGFPVSRFLG